MRKPLHPHPLHQVLLLPHRSRRTLNITIPPHGPSGPMVVKQHGLDRNTPEPQELLLARKRQLQVKREIPPRLQRQDGEQLLGAAPTDGVRERAHGVDAAVHDARAVRVGLQQVQPGEVGFGRDGRVVVRYVEGVGGLERERVVGFGLAAVAGPEDIPGVAVGGGLGVGEWEAGDGADAFGEVAHLGWESDVPVHVVFHD